MDEIELPRCHKQVRMRTPQYPSAGQSHQPHMHNHPSSVPPLSVIIPAYNVEAQIGPCLHSLQAQTWVDFEAIVVEDGSTDSTLEQIRAAIADDPRFRVIQQDNRGLSGARNTGLDAATGDLIAFLDGDDRFAPDFLEKMRAALLDGGADWVSCGMTNCYADGSTNTHSTIHSHPVLPDETTPQIWPLQDWPQVIAHFPSAWNKLYRRAFIGDLRFDEGIWFEDHMFYCQLAARASSLLHLPEPLYLQTRGRVGQITGTCSDRVFEQFTVLDHLAALFAGADKPGGPTALPQLAHRLIRERLGQIQNPDRRDHFLQTSVNWLQQHDLAVLPMAGHTADPTWDIFATASVSVVIPWNGTPATLNATLATLPQSGVLPHDILIVADDAQTSKLGQTLTHEAGLTTARGLVNQGTGPGPARNTGLAAAGGDYIIFVDAGDLLHPRTLPLWVGHMHQAGADMGISPFQQGVQGTASHRGVHDLALFPDLPALMPAPAADDPTNRGDAVLLDLSAEQALMLHCHPTAKIFRRAFLLEQSLLFGTGALDCWPMIHGAALTAKRVIYFPWLAITSDEEDIGRSLWRRPAPVTALADTLDHCTRLWPELSTAPLPPGWQRRLWARALWEELSFARHRRRDQIRLKLAAAYHIHRRGLHRMSAPLDPYISDEIVQLMHLFRRT
jgi:glycosyltransferase involved in cell wall biosynthesis